MHALDGNPRTRVVRDGVEQELLVEQVVPGDLVTLGEGDYVPADGLVVEAAALRLNEATLTGESVPVDKRVAMDERDAAADAHLLSGTAVVHGRGRMKVERTGANSAVGQIRPVADRTHRNAAAAPDGEAVRDPGDFGAGAVRHRAAQRLGPRAEPRAHAPRCGQSAVAEIAR